MQQESIATLCHIEIQRFMLKKAETRNDMKFQRSRIVFNAKYALKIPKTNRNMLFLWSYATRHYRAGQETSRATKQSIHHVRSWHVRFSLEEYPKEGRRYGKFAGSQKRKKSERLARVREEAQLLNDRGALPRGQAMSKKRIHEQRYS